MRDWFAGTPGRELADAERLQIAVLLQTRSLDGLWCIQIGEVDVVDFSVRRRTAHCLRLATDYQPNEMMVDCFSTAEDLPLLSDSADLLLLPHVLEFAADPRRVLREAHRVLAGEGRLVVTGFHPWGVWGLWRLLGGGTTGRPRDGRFLGLGQLRGWLAEIGFEVVQVRGVFPLPPLSSARWMRRLRWLERLQGLPVMPLHAAYVVLAHKHILPLTPIRPRWTTERLPAGAEPEF